MFKLTTKMKIGDVPPGGTAVIGSAIERIDPVDEALSQFPDSKACKACSSASAALRKCVLLAQKTESNARGLFRSYRPRIDEGSTDAKKQVLPYGHGDAATYRDATITAGEAVAMKFANLAFGEATKARQKEADALADAAVAAMQDADRAVTRAVADASAPLAFTRTVSLDDIARVSALREELAGMRPSALAEQWRAWQDDDERRNLLELALGPLLDAIIAGSVKDFCKRSGMVYEQRDPNNSRAGQERQCAFSLKAEIARRRAQQIGEDVKTANACYQQLVGIFIALLGPHAALLPRAQFQEMVKRGTQVDPLSIRPNWLIAASFAMWSGE